MSESDVHRRQILTYKDGQRAEIIKINYNDRRHYNIYVPNEAEQDH